ncbi:MULTISPECIES: RedV protein [unclassified Streptomyces]|uniref:RedV protein n=1 Tax=unclassified Streptomyces TaxID=2593676 RepID=UPI000F6B60DF|nr:MULTISPECIES: RedV protein [unclassified Streptomyces]AZM60896.1 RedV protein [Streptomyces sp. WAC 01438]RSM94537.1 RedV protein [Streptomyces sp. WAC 01420]
MPAPRPPAAPARRFEDALADAAALASLSPSSHNCQPWALARADSAEARRMAADVLGTAGEAGAEYLVLALDRRRELRALDAHATEMRVSCGAYWRLLLRALAAAGWPVLRTYAVEDAARVRPAARWPSHWSPLAVAELRRGRPSAERLEDLWALARGRRTHRGPYRNTALGHGTLDALTRAVAAPPGAERDGIAVRHLTSAQDRASFADLLGRHAGRDFSHPGAWRETHAYVRWSAAEARRHRDGFTADQLFGPLTPPQRLRKRLTLAPPVMRALCLAGYQHRLAAHTAEAVRRRTPAVVALGITEDPDGPSGVAEQLRGGERLLDYWLAATEAGLSLHPLSIVVQHDDLRRETAALFGLAGHPFFVSRLGISPGEAPASLRRPESAAYLSV